LGGLPPIKYHCSVLAVGALKRAIRAYYMNKSQPDWLPKELTQEEKQVLEEEEIIERYYRSMKAAMSELR
ncbi:MAG: iron-sulfur cluster assembly scaffold protein, partial [Desulfurococcaceae archaeon]